MTEKSCTECQHDKTRICNYCVLNMEFWTSKNTNTIELEVSPIYFKSKLRLAILALDKPESTVENEVTNAIDDLKMLLKVLKP